MVKCITATFTEEEYKTMLGALYITGRTRIPDFHRLYGESYVETYSSEVSDGEESLSNLSHLLPEEIKDELVIISLMRISRILQGKEVSGNIIPAELEKATKRLISFYPELAHMNMNEILDWADGHPEIVEEFFEKDKNENE
ncbi:hypothetical protein [Priestia aryabhattai]